MKSGQRHSVYQAYHARRAAPASKCLCLALLFTAGSFIYGFWDHRYLWGALFVFAAAWYWLAIRWVDRHGKWD